MVTGELQGARSHFFYQEKLVERTAEIGIGIQGADTDHRRTAAIVADLAAARQTAEMQGTAGKLDTLAIDPVGIEQPVRFRAARLRHLETRTGCTAAEPGNKRSGKLA